ncbi:Adenine phosphoribosyltransferase-like protein [Citrus sinensis]|uniref:Adenine phosphoribosyltransferase-like protein n=1 Tax=Citrus sinensis TaxID=2711 RepID=A0ACB8KIK5_CITSI|nr:Adenine phosphoribosyltransferase-like protein [Citrus sinensis]
MAGIHWFGQTHQSVNRRSILGSIHGVKCCSGTVNDGNKNTNNKTATPQILKFAVSGVTELLRLFSSFDKGRLDKVSYKQKYEILVSGIDDIVTILRSDYENAYFVTGTELYSRNLRLLVPFFEYPSIGLQNIEKGFNSERNFVLATWKLRTYLKLPWKPLISIDGSTVYELNDEFKITRHAESWNVSALEAVGQIFTPGDQN